MRAVPRCPRDRVLFDAAWEGREPAESLHPDDRRRLLSGLLRRFDLDQVSAHTRTTRTTLRRWLDAYQLDDRGRTVRPRLAPCGTTAAYRRHLRHRELACGPCLRAHVAAMRAHYANQREAA